MKRVGLRVCVVQLAALVMVVASAFGVRADEPRVTVVGQINPAAVLSSHEVDGLARAALAESSGFRFEDAELLFRGDVSSAQAAYGRLLQKLKRGRQAFLSLELESAVAALEAAVAELPEAIAVLDSPERAAEALMYLGATYELMGNESDAQRVFARYHVQFGDIAPDDTVFNPQILARWEAARREVEKQGTASLTIEGPDGSVVFVNGRARGVGKVELTRQRLGEHWVRVSAPFVTSFVSRVTLHARDKQRVVATGLEAEPPAPLPDVSTDDGALALANTLEVDVLGVFAIRERDHAGAIRIALSVHDGQSGKRLFQHEEDAGADLGSRAFAVRRLVAMLLDQTLARPARDEVKPVVSVAPIDDAKARDVPKVDDSPKRKRRVWLWAAASGALALAAGAAVYFIARDEDEPRAAGSTDSGTIVLEF